MSHVMPDWEQLSDAEKARYEREAHEGDALAQFMLAFKYIDMKDIPTGLAWLEKSAGGYGLAALIMGRLYDKGRVVEHSPVDAAVWFKRASELGERLGTMELADMFLGDRGLPRDLKAAEVLYKHLDTPEDELISATRPHMNYSLAKFYLGFGNSKQVDNVVATLQSMIEHGDKEAANIMMSYLSNPANISFGDAKQMRIK